MPAASNRSAHVGSGFAFGPGLNARAIREDGILNEAHATGGDTRRLADLFGLSIQAGTRYTNTVDHPDLTRQT
jgi:hypothetical protein